MVIAGMYDWYEYVHGCGPEYHRSVWYGRYEYVHGYRPGYHWYGMIGMGVSMGMGIVGMVWSVWVWVWVSSVRYGWYGCVHGYG